MAITKERHRFKRGQIIRAVQTLTSGGKPYIEKGSEYVVNAISGDVWAYVKVIGSDNRGYDIHQDVFRGFPVVGEPQRVEGPHTVENEITSMEWDSTDIYYSNNGAGPLMARILYATNDTVHMERWHLTGQARRRFELPISYFLSPRCGWKLR